MQAILVSDSKLISRLVMKTYFSRGLGLLMLLSALTGAWAQTAMNHQERQVVSASEFCHDAGIKRAYHESTSPMATIPLTGGDKAPVERQRKASGAIETVNAETSIS
jgi:hypothetical protein